MSTGAIAVPLAQYEPEIMVGCLFEAVSSLCNMICFRAYHSTQHYETFNNLKNDVETRAIGGTVVGVRLWFGVPWPGCAKLLFMRLSLSMQLHPWREF